MSERILKALMQLFAIIADVDDISNISRRIVQLFLKQQLPNELVDEYLKIYDDYLEAHHQISNKKKDSKRKRTSLHSVKVLRICTQINAELAQKQKVVVLLRLIEYVYSDKRISEQEFDFVSTVAETFNISRDEFESCLSFVTCDESKIPDTPNFLIINHQSEAPSEEKRKHIFSETIEGQLVILNIESVGMFAIRYFGEEELYLNGQILRTDQVYILTQGSSIRSSKVSPIYYSDVIGCFLSDLTKSKIVFAANEIEYKFPGGKIGLHKFSFSEESGKLVGIMGGSGAGKSTMLNVLNGNNKPASGEVLVNGINIHEEKDKIEGTIGFVSQDDLLIEELTVFQNLYYNAKLCFDGFSDKEITNMVLKMLNSLGLLETKNLKVGSPLDKRISGGQRKRLNIALELIREPSVLFLDEPTSGLSSRDSENIMDLLKELALKGKLVFVVIHQPSSEIYKMFDKMLILDVGGYFIYDGNPVDGIIYFKTIVQHVKSSESECLECGNVNPEQIFNIIESKVLDEYGNLTDHRKISPKEWNQHYLEKLAPKSEVDDENLELPKSTSHIPGKFKQFKVFITRDVLSKLTNMQYLLINLLEAPALALILAYFFKFKDSDVSNELGYVFINNENLPSYMFMAVIIALFIGMTVSAEEIIRDEKIRKRESFLNLSNGSYLVSKILIMFTLSAIQTICFVMVGNMLLGIKDMWIDYWFVLFSTACFANMLGLNISASFNSAVTIYILIPFLIIPQLLFSGVVVKFDKLNPTITSQTHVPLIGEVMASRWAFEALAVRQFKENKYERQIYRYEKDKSISSFKKNFWIAEITSKIGSIENYLNKKGDKQKVTADLLLIRNEITRETKRVKDIKFNNLEALTLDGISPEVIAELRQYVQKLKSFYMRIYNGAERALDDHVRKLQATEESKKRYNKLKNDYQNESLSDLVRNKTDLTQILEVDGRLIQKTDPIFLDPEGFRAHFFAPTKKLFGNYFDTYWVNMVIIWLMSVVMIITLYFDALRKAMEGTGKLFSRKRS